MAGLAADFEPKHPEAHRGVRRTLRAGPREPPGRPGADPIPSAILLGACFTMEYALESVALFNPSIVPALRQDGVPSGSIRFVMSLRATGEGHVSSIIFRVGLIDAEGNIELEPPGILGRPLKASVPDAFEKAGVPARPGDAGRPDRTDRADPRSARAAVQSRRAGEAIDAARGDERASGFLEEAADSLIAATQANYRLELPDPPLSRESEIVIFPFSDIERHGIEDLRLVLFTDDDGDAMLLRHLHGVQRRPGLPPAPRLLRAATRSTCALLTGECAQNKGMALFPRRINGQIRDDLADRQREPLLHGVGRRRRSGMRPGCSRHRNTPGRSCRSATAGRRWRPRRDGCS